MIYRKRLPGGKGGQLLFWYLVIIYQLKVHKHGCVGMRIRRSNCASAYVRLKSRKRRSRVHPRNQVTSSRIKLLLSKTTNSQLSVSSQFHHAAHGYTLSKNQPIPASKIFELWAIFGDDDEPQEDELQEDEPRVACIGDFLWWRLKDGVYGWGTQSEFDLMEDRDEDFDDELES